MSEGDYVTIMHTKLYVTKVQHAAVLAPYTPQANLRTHGSWQQGTASTSRASGARKDDSRGSIGSIGFGGSTGSQGRIVILFRNCML